MGLGRRLLWPALTTAAMLALTSGLGIWQLQRLAWKTGLLASIDSAETAPVLPLPARPEQFHRYVVTGHFAAPAARYGAEVRVGPAGPEMGEQLLGILLRPDQPPLLVDRGWVSDSAPPPPDPGTVTLTGYVRLPEPRQWMGARDDPANKRFYALDPAPIAAALGYPSAAPFTLVALGDPGSIPGPAQHLPRPPNDHLSYAVTWFSLSAALAIIFAVYVRQAMREKTPT
jgi:surfeit locus 1 family protein